MESTITVTVVVAGVIFVGIGLALIMWKRLLQWGHRTLRGWAMRSFPALLEVVDFAFEVLDKVTVYTTDLIERIGRTIGSWRELRKRLLKQEIKIERRDNGQYARLVVNWMYEPEQAERKIVREIQEELISWEDLPLDTETKRKLIHENQAVINLTEERDKEIAERDREIMEYAQRM